MKQIFRKDVRENFRFTLLGMAVFTLVIVLTFHWSGDLLHQLIRRQTSGSVDALQPILSGNLLGSLTFLCGIFGGALGWFQARSEAHRDLWAFLIHRPITRTGIFRGKMAAGLVLYFVGAGIPMLAAICLAAMPGVVAAPFEPAMALPMLTIFLSGIAYYFAGMLTALRQARCFGSRTFGLGVAVGASVAAWFAPLFWLAALWTLLLIACVGVAAWGAYQSGGFYEGQPRFGKFALTVSLVCGSCLVLALLAGLIELLLHESQDNSWQNYTMNQDGQIFVNSSHDGVESYADLDGKPLIDPATGQPMRPSEFNSKHGVPSMSAAVGNVRQSYFSASRFFELWGIANKDLWFLDRHGKLTGYSGVTRRHLGNMVARGASGEEAFMLGGAWERFRYYNAYNQPSVLATTSTVYRVNLEDRKLQAIFTADANDPIIGFEHSGWFNHVLVLSSNSIRVLNMLGDTRASLPYTPGPATYPVIEVSNLKQVNGFAIWFQPKDDMNAKSHYKMPIHVVWISRENQVVKTRDLPTLQTPDVDTLTDKVLYVLTPPGLQLIDYDDLNARSLLCLIPSVICAAIGWSLARRYRFSAGATTIWVLFLILLGIPGLLTFLCAQDWPRRETCPQCGKLRVVDREHCEHCAAGFPPPDKIGIEIFEPLKAS